MHAKEQAKLPISYLYNTMQPTTMSDTAVKYGQLDDVEMVDTKDPGLKYAAEDSGYSSSHSLSSSPSSLSNSSDSGFLSCPNQPGHSHQEWMRCVEHIGVDFTIAPWDNAHSSYHRALNRNYCGDMSQEKSSAGDLENDVHPLFDLRNFVKDVEDLSVQDKLWGGIAPALQLASRMLTSAPVMAFFRRLKYGVEVTDSMTGSKLTKSSYMEDIHFADEGVEEDLLELSQKLLFFFGAIKPDSEKANQIHAFHTLAPEEVSGLAFIRCDPSDLPTEPGKYRYIVINEAYGHYFKHSQERTVERDQKTQWSLATTLIHEIAHAYYARDRDDGNEDYNEPVYDRGLVTTEEEPELGQQLDFLLYGVELNNIVHSDFGVHSQHWPLLFNVHGKQTTRSQSHTIFATCPQYIASWFQESTWTDLEAKWSSLQDRSLIRQSKDFHVPAPDWGVVRESLLQNGPWLWTPRRKIMNTLDAVSLTQNHAKACVETYEAKDRAAVKRLQKLLAKSKRK